MRKLVVFPFLFLAACGGGGGGSDDSSDNSGATQNALNAGALFFGAAAGEPSANGLAFATNASMLDGVEGAGDISVRMVRAETDWETGETTFILTDETIDVTVFNDEGGDFEITIDGQTLTFLDGVSNETNANGETWAGFLNASSGAVSGSGTIFDQALEPNRGQAGAFDAQAYFVYGFETDPAEIAALNSTVDYAGALEGFGQLLDANGDVIANQLGVIGTVNLTANFTGSGTISGTVAGEIDGVGDPTFDLEFDTAINGNAFASDLTCTTGCDDNASVISGGFFGQNGAEVSGLIGFDLITDVDDPANPGNTISGRLMSAGGYTAEQQTP